MELWIRSQDKEKLIKVTQLIIKEDVCIENKKGHAIASIEFKNTYGYNFLYLGIYSTKERALEVLNEIQDKIKNICKFQLVNEDYECDDCIYEMPKE